MTDTYTLSNQIICEICWNIFKYYETFSYHLSHKFPLLSSNVEKKVWIIASVHCKADIFLWKGFQYVITKEFLICVYTTWWLLFPANTIYILNIWDNPIFTDDHKVHLISADASDDNA